MSTLAKTLLTPEQYLEIERKAEFKSEYFQGEMFAMAGAGSAHNLIKGDVMYSLNHQLRARNCFVYNSDMRLRVSPTGLYTYPDVQVVCGEQQFLDAHRDSLLNPSVIVEVLSPSTEAYDRGRKFEHYRKLESLREYLLISSDRVSAHLYVRQPDGEWAVTVAVNPEDTIDLRSIDCRLKLADVYLKS